MPRISLFTKILLWFWISFIVLIAFFLTAVGLQSRMPLTSQFSLGSIGPFQHVEHQIAIELSDSPRYSWDTILAEYGRRYEVSFVLASIEGLRLAGTETELPQDVRTELAQRFRMIEKEKIPDRSNETIAGGGAPGPVPPSPKIDPNGPGSVPPSGYRPPAPQRKLEGPLGFIYMHSEDSGLYWAGLRTLIYSAGGRQNVHAFLLASSSSITGNGLFLDMKPWMAVFGAILLLATLMWLPFARRLTSRVGNIMTVAEQIGQGQFDAKLDLKGSDELSRLGHAITTMSERLEGFVHGQKRFLGDIAHELGSPIARIQLGLSILEQRVSDDERRRVQDILEEVEELSALVNELLAFTRADLTSASAKLLPVSIADAVEKAIVKESIDEVEIESDIQQDLKALAAPDLLVRAIANLVRNAIRYAGDEGPIRVVADHRQNKATISVIDSGPGVPESELEKLFDPFYRVESSRSRESGGTGLGLSIVKSCIEACEGSVIAENREAGGFAVTITLQAGSPAKF